MLVTNLQLWQHWAHSFTTSRLHFQWFMWISPDSDAGEPQPPLIPNDTIYLYFTFGSRLPMDIANGFDLSLCFLNLSIKSNEGDGFDLGSSMAHPSLKNGTIFNPYPPLKKLRIFESNFKEIFPGTIIPLKMFSFESSLFNFFYVVKFLSMSPSFSLFDFHLWRYLWPFSFS